VSRPRAHRASEDGFTMVELVMAVAILGIISITLGVVGTVMFKTLGQTQDRLTESRGPRFASVYWVPDVASADVVNPSTAGVPTVCGAAAPLVTLQWTDDRTALTTVSYGIVTTGVVSKLERRFCINGSTLPTRTTTIAPSVAPSATTVTCGNGTSYSACTTPDTDKSLLLTIAAKSGGTFSVDAFREVS
jgi:prepilin-type N-terminal cleavage/methylation domain-containing protein